MHDLARRILELRGGRVHIETLVYSNLLNVPSAPLSRVEGIHTLFCPYLRSHEKRLYEKRSDDVPRFLGQGYPGDERINPADDEEYGLLLNEWLPVLRSAGVSLGVFAYYQLVFHDETRRSDRSRYLRHPAPELIRDEARWFKKCGMRVFYDCSWPYPGFWPDARLYAFYPYLLWDVDADIDALIEEYESEHSGFFAALDDFGAKLDAGDRDIPDKEYQKVANLAESLPELFGKSVMLWLKYVKLGCASWSRSLNNDAEGVMETERRIKRLFEENRPHLEPFVDVDWMINYSRSALSYFDSLKKRSGC